MSSGNQVSQSHASINNTQTASGKELVSKLLNNSSSSVCQDLIENVFKILKEDENNQILTQILELTLILQKV